MTDGHDDSLALTVLRVVRRRLVLVVACFVIVPAVALAYSLLSEERYEATASLLFRDTGFDELLFGVTLLAPAQDPRREAATNATLLSLAEISRRTAPSFPGRTPRDIEEAITVAARPDANVVDVTAEDPSAAAAARLANRFALEYISFRRDADRAQIADARELLEQQLARTDADATNQERRARLDEQLEQLELIASLQTGNAELVQTAIAPTSPAAPRPRRNTALGAMVGLLLGLALAFLLDRLDRRVHDPDEAAELFDRPILGIIPQSRGVERATGGAALPVADAEAFRLVRANLRYFNISTDIRSVLVTSAAPGDGKSSIAWHLASTTAALGHRTLLIEADLRNPTLSRFVANAGGRPGLSALLAGHAELDDVVLPVATPRLGRNGSDSDDPMLDVVLAGERPPNPTDLLESARMAGLVRLAEDRYDLVVLDTPPTSAVSDAIPLVNVVSGVLVVCRLRKNTRDALETLRDQLANLGAPVLGLIVNGMPVEGLASYGYAAEYG